MFRKKPVVIEAMQFPGMDCGLGNGTLSVSSLEDIERFDDWFTSNGGKGRYVGNTCVIKTLEGDMTAMPGDWIIKGVKGEFYPCKPDIFSATYDLVE